MRILRKVLLVLVLLLGFGASLSSAAKSNQPLVITTYSDAVRFSTRLQEASTLQVEVFDLQGARLFDSGPTANRATDWRLSNQNGVRVANGVYLYVVTVWNKQGQQLRRKLGKLAVVPGAIGISAPLLPLVGNANTLRLDGEQFTPGSAPGDHAGDWNFGRVSAGTGGAILNTQALIEAKANATGPTIEVRNQGGAGGAQFRMRDDLSGADFKFKSTGLGGFKIRDQANGIDVITIPGGSGNVGIGTATPASKLTVAGVIESSSGGIKFPDGTTQTTAATGGGSAGGWTDDGTVVRLSTSTDKVGIGTSTPTEQLEITGNFNLPSSTATVGVIKFGGVPVIRSFENFGVFDFFAGPNAGSTSMAGNGNVGVGANALASDTTGGGNTAVGSSALRFNTTGGGNTAVGSGALDFNTTGQQNTAVGQDSLNRNTTAINNTATGFQALSANTTGIRNTAVGEAALLNNTTAQQNTAVGSGALKFNTASFNTAVGSSALISNTTGQQNTAVGQDSLNRNTTGLENTAMGENALFNNTAASFSTAVGKDALFNNTGSENTAVGHQALLDNTTGTHNTAVGSGALDFNTTGVGNTAVGREALFSNRTGSNNTAIGNGADVVNESRNSQTAIGANTFVDGNNATAIGSGAQAVNDNTVVIGNSFVTVIHGAVDFTFTSDVNQKENFLPLDEQAVLSKLMQIPVRSWNYIGHDTQKFRHYGPTAQDFFAQFGHDDFGTIGTETTITGSDMGGIMMIGIQALYERSLVKDEQIEQLTQGLAEKTQKINTLQTQLKTLLGRMTQLEREVESLKEK